MHCGQLIHHCQPGELECIIAIRLAFDLRPPPGFPVGIGDEEQLVEFFTQVRQPSRRVTGFKDDDVGTLFPYQIREYIAAGIESYETVLFIDVTAGDCLELSEVECEDLHGRVLLFDEESE